MAKHWADKYVSAIAKKKFTVEPSKRERGYASLQSLVYEVHTVGEEQTCYRKTPSSVVVTAGRQDAT
jgi:hypothetical protein